MYLFHCTTAKHECTVPKYNNPSECRANGGKWVQVDSWNMPPPECIENGFSRDNHLGNTKTGFTNVFNWEIPRLDLMKREYLNEDGKSANCVFRIRYLRNPIPTLLSLLIKH